MKIKRRDFIAGSLATAATLGMPVFVSAADKIKFGSILDTSGIFDLYGKPMDQAVRLAIDEINAEGGLLGREIEVVSYDTQSNMSLYTQFAQKLARQDKVDVVHGGILSASREAIRPTLKKRKVLYFYNVQYEGGVCDRNIFCTGITPAQQAAALVPHTMNLWGKKIYTLAADYNYGQITAKWIQYYAQQNGGNVVQTDFFPLDVADFGATIQKIQEAKPDMIMSVLVGGAHLSFYRQWAAAGMNQNIPMASTTMGAGNEQVVLTPEEGNGIYLAYSHSKDIKTKENLAFLDKWKQKYGSIKLIHELAVATYQGVHLWAEGVRKAGSLDRLKIIEALETGIGIQGPAGKVTIDPQTHHVVIDIHVMEVMNQKMNVKKTIVQQPPLDTQRFCDLKKNPNANIQYEIDI